MALEIIIILSMVQGITEFLPISSSAHLIIIPEIFGSISSKRSFDVSLHFGSLLAVIFYLKKDISKIALDTIFLKHAISYISCLKVSPKHFQFDYKNFASNFKVGERKFICHFSTK